MKERKEEGKEGSEERRKRKKVIRLSKPWEEANKQYYSMASASVPALGSCLGSPQLTVAHDT